MATDASPASPAREDPPADDPMDADADAEEDHEEAEEQGEEEQPKKKRGRKRRVPATPSSDRPSRERKTVERYAELTPRSTPAKKNAAILQGSGTKLKEIPNVSFKLSKRKADDNLQSLHTLMFGKKSNAHFMKRNISQFSGFVWTDNPEKQRNKLKDKLDKMNKEKLLDFCDILDVQAKGTSRKEEVTAKLLEFLESPSITRDVILSDVKKQKGKKRRRKSKVSRKTTADGASGEKKKRKSRKPAVEDEKENDDEDDAGPAGSEDSSIGESDEEPEVKEETNSDEEPEVTPAKKKLKDDKQVKKEAGSKAKENDASAKKTHTKSVKSVSKPDVELENKKAGKKAPKSSTKESNASEDKPKKRVSKPKKDEAKESQSNNKSRKKQGAKTSTGNKGKGKGSTDGPVPPTVEELHAVVSDTLKEVDFNTATLADILRKLGDHFKMDLMDRKSEVKRIIEEVINSMSDDEGEEEEDREENGKEANSKDDPDEADEE